MLELRRRHLKSCPHRAITYTRCKCPIWVYGTRMGRRVRKSLDTKNWEAAQRMLRDLDPDEMPVFVTVLDAKKRFIDDCLSRGLSEDTIAKFERLTSKLADDFPGAQIASVTTDDLARFREGWELKPSTARRRLEELRSFFKFCIERGWVKDNPAKSLRPPKETVIERKPFEKEELEKIAWAIPLFPTKGIYGNHNPARLKAFVAVLRWTGLRISDAVRLKRSQVVNGSVILRTHKNKKPVRLPLHEEAIEGLENIKSAGEYFFWSGEGNPRSCIGDWQRTLKRLSRLSGCHVTAHRFRHTFIAELLANGISLAQVSAIVGTTEAILEKHYSQWVDVRQKAIDSAVMEVWSKSGDSGRSSGA